MVLSDCVRAAERRLAEYHRDHRDRGVRGPIQQAVVDRLRADGPLACVSLAIDLDRPVGRIQAALDSLEHRRVVVMVDAWRYAAQERRR